MSRINQALLRLLALALILAALMLPSLAFAAGSPGKFEVTVDAKQRRISVKAEQAGMREVLAALAAKTGMHVEVLPGVSERNVSVDVKDIPYFGVSSLLEKMGILNYGVGFERETGRQYVYVVNAGSELPELLKGKTVVKPGYFANGKGVGRVKGKEIVTEANERKGYSVGYVKDEVLLKFHLGVTQTEIDGILKKYNLVAAADNTLTKVGYVKVTIPDGRSVKDVSRDIAKEYKLKLPEPNYIQSVLTVNDPLYENQWYVQDTRFDKAWPMLKSKETVKVAVIDTGVQTDHPDLQGKILPGYDFVNGKEGAADDNGHGTFVTGIIAANTNNIGIKGLYDNARIIPVKVIDANGVGTYEDAVKGVIYAADSGARVINMSIGGYGFSYLLQDAIDYALERGCIVVAAGGNDGIEAPVYPAAYPDVIGVAALDRDGKIWSGSNSGRHISVSAPGVDIVSTGLAEEYVFNTGTSASTPMVTALVAMLVVERAESSGSSIRRLVTQAAIDLGEKGKDKIFGFGEVDSALALQQSVKSFHDVSVRHLRIESPIVEKGGSVYISANIDNFGTFDSEICDVVLYVLDENKREIRREKDVKLIGTKLIIFGWFPDDISKQLKFEIDVIAANDVNMDNNSITSQIYNITEKDNLYLLYPNKPPVHQWIALQAYNKISADAKYSEFANYIDTNINSNNYSLSFSPPSSWSTSKTQPDLSSYTLLEGAWEEDQGNYNIPGISDLTDVLDWTLLTTNGSGYDSVCRHFWDQTGGYNNGLLADASASAVCTSTRNSSALTQADQWWSAAIASYSLNTTNDKKTAYYYLGRVAHLLMDMSVPTHVLNDPHANDNYESFTKDNSYNSAGNYKRITSASVNTSIPTPIYSTYPTNGYDQKLTDLFYKLADVANDFDSDDTNGRNSTYGLGKFRFARNQLSSGKTVLRVEYWGLVSKIRDLTRYTDYDLVSNNCENRIYYYQAFYDQINNSTNKVRVYYTDGTYDSFSNLDENAYNDVFTEPIACIYQPTLQANAIGYVAALYQLFWDKTHFQLTVSKSGSGSGTVTSNPTGINCGSSCNSASAVFELNKSVVLTATSTTGSSFAGWTGISCSGTGTCTVAMDAAKTVMATFNDTTAPTVTISSPTSNSTYSTSSSPLNVGGAVSDNIGVTSVTWSNDRGGSGGCTTAFSCTGITLYSGLNNITIKGWDAVNNSGSDTLAVTYTPPDTTPPAAVTNLMPETSPYATRIALAWTAPGDDGNTGTANSYDIRYSTATITEANWASATQVTGEPSPATAGTGQTYNVTGLTCNTTYYFALKTSDEVPNVSAISNVPSKSTAACPTYTVTYNGNGNTSGTVPTDVNSYLQGASVTVKDNTGNLAKTGYSFAGWNTAANGSGTSYIAGNTFAMGSANVTLYAKWTALPTYTVTYNGNGNTSGSVPTDSNNYLQGAQVTVLGNTGNLTKTGYSFAGWNSAANGSGTSYAVGSTFTMGSANVTLYAKWTVLPTFVLTVASTNPASGVAMTVAPNDNNSQGNGITQFTRAYNSGTPVTITAPATAGGNNFGSWSGCSSTSGYQCIVTMDAAKTVTASYSSQTTNPQTITFPPIPTKTYGNADFNPGATATSGLTVEYESDNVAVATIVNGKIHIVGQGTATITARQPGDVNWQAATPVQQTLTVNKAALTITADNKSKVVNTPNPALTWTPTGFVNNETVAVVSGSPVLATTADVNSPVGSYDITITQGTLAADNYNFSFVNGNLSVTSASFLLYDDFSSGLANWTPFGSPSPRILSSVFGKSDVFDNNGDPNYNSGAVSKNPVDCTNGCTIESEIYLDFSNLGGCWNGASIGLALNSNPTFGSTGQNEQYGLYFSLDADGDACWGSPPEYRRHSFLGAQIYAEDGTYENVSWINADQYANGWHILKIDVQADRTIKFKIDDTLAWTPTKKLHPSIMSGRNVTLGTRSSGSAGKSYHDWLKVTEAIPQRQSQAISFTSIPTKTYGNADFDPGATASSGLTVEYESDNVAVVTIVNGKIHIVGQGTATITARQPGDANWQAATPVPQTLTVNKAALTITADNKSKSVNAANPPLTWTASGFVNGETASVLSGTPSLATTAETNSPVGTYPITITQGTLTAANYSFGFVSGTLTVSTYDLNDGLVAWYPFSGDANDATTNGNTGTINGTVPTTDKNGNSSSAYYFNGVNSRISVPSTSILSPQAQVTLSAWIKASDFSQCHTLVSKGATYSALYADYNLRICNNGNIYWESATSSNAPRYVFAPFTFVNETWYHVTATYNAGTVRLYANGTMINEGVVSNQSLRTSSQPLYIGIRYPDYPTAGSTTTKGSIDEVRIYNRALSDAEVQALYDLTGGGAQSQTISFPEFTAKTYGDADFAPGATASSGLTVEYESDNTAVATIINGNVHIFGQGTATITARQPGDANWQAATPVQQTLTVNKAALTITADNKSKVVNTANPPLTWTASGFVNGETTSVLSGTPSLTTTAETNSPVGTYPITITQGTLTADNYSFGFLSGTLTISTYDLNDGLVAWYPLNGDANDASNNGNTGTINGAVPTTDKNGNTSSAYYFDGVNSRISVPSTSILSPQAQVTLSAWIKASDFSQCNTLVSKGATYSALYADYNLMICNNGNIYWESATSGNAPRYVFAPFTFVNDTWYHVTATYTAGTVRLYANGTMIKEGSVSNQSLRTSSQPLYIGIRYPDYPTTGSTTTKGSIDEVRVYNRALSDAEVQALYGLTIDPIRNLRVTVVGNGSVHSTPEGIAGSSGTLSAPFAHGTPVTLTASAGTSPCASFDGWSGGGCSGTGDCLVTLNADTDVTAPFSSLMPVKAAGIRYATVMDAYLASPSGSSIVIFSHAEEFVGNLDLDRTVTAVLRGGRSCDTTGVVGVTAINGMLSVGKGALTVENVEIR